MSVIKVLLYMLRVKNMHLGHPQTPVIDVAKQSRAMCNTLLGKAKPSCVSVFHHLPSVGPKQLCALAHLGCTRKVGTS